MNVLSMNIIVVIYTQALYILTISTISQALVLRLAGIQQEGESAATRGAFLGLYLLTYIQKNLYMLYHALYAIYQRLFFFFFLI